MSRSNGLLSRLADKFALLDEHRQHRRVDELVYAVLIVILLVLVVGPLAFLVGGSFWTTDPFTAGGHFTLANYAEAYLDPEIYEIALNTLIIATGTTILANVLGVGLAWAIVRVNTPFRGVLESVVVLPYLVPSYLLAVAYIFLLSPEIGLVNRVLESAIDVSLSIYSLWGIVFVKGISYAPLCFLLTRGAFENIDANLEDAARMSGANLLTVLRTVTIPVLAPSVTASVLLIFTKGLETFSVPAFLGLPASPPIHVFSTRIWQALSMEHPANYGLATALATSLLVVAGLGLMLQRKAVGLGERFTTVSGRGFTRRRLDAGRWRWVVLGLAVLPLVFGILLPFAVLLLASVSDIWYGKLFFLSDAASFTLENFRQLFSMNDFLIALTNSFLLATTGAFVGMILACVSSYLVVRGTPDDSPSSLFGTASAVVDQLTYLPVAVPGIVFATGVLWFVLTVPTFGLYGSLWLLGLAYVAHHLPLATRTTHGAMAQLDAELEEQAHVAGAGWFATMKDIVFPLINENFVAGFLLLFISMFRELSISILLYSRESLVLAVMIFNLKLTGDYEALSALSVVMVAIILVFVGLVRYGFGTGVVE